MYRDQIDYAAVDRCARQIAGQHTHLIEAGRYWAGLLTLVADRCEAFAHEVAFQAVRGIMLSEGSLDDYRLHLSASPRTFTSPILLAACQQFHLDARLLPEGVTTFVSPLRFEVSGRTTTVIGPLSTF